MKIPLGRRYHWHRLGVGKDLSNPGGGTGLNRRFSLPDAFACGLKLNKSTTVPPVARTCFYSVTDFQLNPKPARYFLSRSESFVLLRFLKDSAKRVRPASERVRDRLQTRMT